MTNVVELASYIPFTSFSSNHNLINNSQITFSPLKISFLNLCRLASPKKILFINLLGLISMKMILFVYIFRLDGLIKISFENHRRPVIAQGYFDDLSQRFQLSYLN